MVDSTETLPEAVVQEKSGFSLVWLVPVVAGRSPNRPEGLPQHLAAMPLH